jgi:hypothetical protein
METPDTTEAVTEAIADGIERMLAHPDAKSSYDIARDAIRAHNKAMAEAVPERPIGGLGADQAVFNEGFNEARRLFLGEEA